MALQYSENNLVTTILSGSRRITNQISQIANSQQFGLFLFSKLSSFCPPAHVYESDFTTFFITHRIILVEERKSFKNFL